MMNNKPIFLIFLIFCIIIFSISAVAAVNVNSIIQQMEKSYNQQMSKIKDLTVVQEMEDGFMSITSTLYQKKAKVNNRDTFKIRSESSAMGMDSVVIFDGVYTWAVDPISGEVKKEEREFDPLNVWKMLDPKKAKYLGEEKYEGKNVYKLQLDGAIWMMGNESMANAGMNEETDVEMYSIFWIDKKDFVPLRSQNFIKSTTVEDGKQVTMNNVIDAVFLDYRRVGSLLLSHKMVVSNQMDVDDPSLSEEEKEEAKAFMMNAMGKMEFVVKSAEVNVGLTDELFDGTRLEPQEPMFKNMPGMPQGGQGNSEMGSMSQEEIQELMQKAMEGMEGNEGFQEMMENMMQGN